MYKKILNEIIKHQKIIIIRHKNPDFDAYGSQLGLYYSLKNNFKDKDIYVAGDENDNNPFLKKMDILSLDDYKDALVIVVDTSTIALLNDDYYKNADKVVVLDHHNNEPELGDYTVVKSDYSSASEVVTEFLTESKLKITKESADALYLGIAGDSNRFLYRGTTSNTFKMCSVLLDASADIIEVYKMMQKDEAENEKRFRGYILSTFIIKDRVAYNYVSKEDRDKYGVSFSFSSRGCVNLLSGIKGVDAFINFTVADDNETVYVELRSKDIPILNVAKAHDGGGHNLACGCRINVGDDYMLIVDELNKEISNYEYL